MQNPSSWKWQEVTTPHPASHTLSHVFLLAYEVLSDATVCQPILKLSTVFIDVKASQKRQIYDRHGEVSHMYGL